MKKIGKFVFFLLIFSFQCVFANQGTVAATATVDRNVMRPGDTFTLTITVESEGGVQVDSPILPDLSGFNIINRWSGSEIQSVFENGRFSTKRRVRYNFQLQAMETGVFNIGAIRVKVSGQELMTKPIRIEVSGSAPEAPAENEDEGFGLSDDMDVFDQLLRDRMRRFMGRDSGPRSRQIPDLDASDAYFIELEVDKTKAFVGEQIIASYYLVTRAQISDIDTLKYPTLTGFWKEDIELATRLNFKPEVINGIAYNKALLVSYALFPMKAGLSIIDSYKAKCTLVNFNPFGAPGQKVLERESQNITIEVMPLPKVAQPSDFLGAVGDFTLKTEIDKIETKVSEPISLKLRFEGSGNAKLIELPKLIMPDGVDIYSAKNSSKFFKDGRSYKEFEFLLVPRKPGELILPEIAVSLFNPQKQTYYKLKSEARAVKVLPGTGGELATSRPLELADKDKVDMWPKPVYELTLLKKTWSNMRASVWSGAYAVSTIFFLAWVVTATGIGRPRDSLRRQVKRKLKLIHQAQKKSDFRTVGTLLSQLASSVLGQLAEYGGGGKDVSALLLKAPPSFRNDYGAKLKELMSVCETLAYAPDHLISNLKNQETLAKIIADMELVLLKALEINFDQDVETHS